MDVLYNLGYRWIFVVSVNFTHPVVSALSGI